MIREKMSRLCLFDNSFTVLIPKTLTGSDWLQKAAPWFLSMQRDTHFEQSSAQSVVPKVMVRDKRFELCGSLKSQRKRSRRKPAAGLI
jgi:hypothetical protein